MYNLIVTVLLLTGPHQGQHQGVVANHFATEAACTAALPTAKIEIPGHVKQVSKKCELAK